MERDVEKEKCAPCRVVHAERLLCPLPILRVEAAMGEVPCGGILEVWATDPGIEGDLAAWCRSHGHGLLSLERKEGVFIGRVRRRA